MSDLIENKHAKPAMSDLIIDKPGVPIDQDRANSMAIFAFKTAVVLDQLVTGRAPFFERSARHEFRKSLKIPSNVNMWLTRFASHGRGEVNTLYHEGTTPEGARIETYVCTFSAEHLVLQVVAINRFGLRSAEPENKFIAVPFWPAIEPGFKWPPPTCLKTVGEFDGFSDRWLNVVVTRRFLSSDFR